ncbi:L-fuculose phosphate aldolase [Streptomyces hirsutus]
MPGQTPPPFLPLPTDRLRFAMPPMHESVEDERRHRKERLAGALRLFGRLGFEDGVSGHITARDPEFSDCFWVNPFGMPFRHVTVSDLVLANREGRVVQGGHHVNQAAFTVHAQVHTARPDVVAVAHCHSVHGRALAALGDLLDPIARRAARSTRTTPSTTPTAVSPSARTRAGASRPRSAPARRWCCAITGCSPWATRWTRRPGGSCPWSAPARCRSARRRRAAPS